MDQSVEQLVTHINRLPSGDNSHVRTNIEALNEIDSRFSTSVARVLDTARIGSHPLMIAASLRMLLANPHGVYFAVDNLPNIANRCQVGDNLAKIVLSEVRLVNSISTMELPSTYSKNGMIRNCQEGLVKLASTSTFMESDVFEISDDEADRYFRPIAVVESVLSGEEVFILHETYRSETTAFTTWVTAQDNMDELLRTALIRKTLEPQHLTDFLRMEKVTTVPLHDGLI